MTDGERSVSRRIAEGAVWTIGMRLGIRAIGVVSIIILARILVPEDFGVVAKASMIASFLELFTQFGLEAALIQNQSAGPAHYDTVWTIHAIRGAVIGAILVLVAEPAASFLNEPVLASVLLYYAFASFLTGLENVGVVDFRKKLRFDRDFQFNLIKKIVGFTVTIGVAYVWRSYWAFVAGVVAISIAGLLASFSMSAVRPKPGLKEWRSLFHSSKWIFAAGLINAMSSKLDTFILSRFSTTAIVGKYTVAYEIAGSASTELAMPIARATMPGLAMLSTEPEKFKSTYTSSILVVLLIAIPSAVGLSALSELVTVVVLGENWIDAAQLIKILAIYGVARAVFSMSASSYLGSGQFKAYANLQFANLFLRVTAMVIGFWTGGVVGLAWGVLWAAIAFNTISLAYQTKLGFLDLGAFLNGVWRVLIAAIVMYLVLTVVAEEFGFAPTTMSVSTLAIQVMTGAAVFVGSLAALWFAFGGRDAPEYVAYRFVTERLR